MRSLTLRGLLLAALLALVPAAGARAATFTPADGAELQQAFVTAAGDVQDDTIVLSGATTYTRSGGFGYSTGQSAKLTLVGNGATITATGSGQAILAVGGGTVDVSGLKVQALAPFTFGVQVSGGTTATLDDIAVSGQTSGTGQSSGISLSASSITATNLTSSATASQGIYAGGTVVTLTGAKVTGAASRQLQVGGGNAAISDLDLRDPAGSSAIGLEVDGPGIATVRRARISGSGFAAAAYFSGKLTLTDSLLLLAGGSGRGLTVGDINNSFGHASAIDAQRVTIVGTGASGQLAANAGDGGPPTGADHHTIALSDSIVSGVPNPLSCNEPDAAANNSITVNTTALSLAGTIFNTCADGGSDFGINLGAGLTSATPDFADAAAGDYRPLFTSPLLDLGATSDPGAGADLGGGLRFVNGAVDLGAYEYQRRAPEVTAGGSPSSPAIGQPVTLTATATDADPGETAQLTYQWQFSDGGSANGPSAEHVFQVAGGASATVTVTDPAGLKTTKDVALTVVAPPGPQPAPGPATPAPITTATAAAADRTAPVLGKLRVAKTIRAATTLPAAVTRGGQVRFTLSEAATVTVRFERLKGKRAVRVPGTVKLKLAAGKRALRFTGRLSRKRTLKPGAYRIVLTPTDAAGNAGRAVRAPFTLLPSVVR